MKKIIVVFFLSIVLMLGCSGGSNKTSTFSGISKDSHQYGKVKAEQLINLDKSNWIEVQFPGPRSQDAKMWKVYKLKYNSDPDEFGDILTWNKMLCRNIEGEFFALFKINFNEKSAFLWREIAVTNTNLIDPWKPEDKGLVKELKIDSRENLWSEDLSLIYK